MNEIHLPHSFFDPSSRYNRLRSASDPHEKLVGYFDWLDYKHRHKLAKERLAARGAPIVVRLDRPDKEVRIDDVDCPQTPTLGGRYYMNFRLVEEDDRPKPVTRCRVLLLEREVLERLREFRAAEGLPLDGHDETAIRQLFTEDLLDNSLEVPRILSALPEFEGRIDEEGEVRAEDGIPFGRPNVPDDTWIIVVYELPPAAQEN